MGRQVDLLMDHAMEAGRHTVQGNADAVPSGVYFYRITAGDFTSVKKMTLLK